MLGHFQSVPVVLHLEMDPDWSGALGAAEVGGPGGLDLGSGAG